MVAYELIGNPVQMEGRYTWFYMSCQFAKRLANKLVRLAHQLNFILCLQKYLHQNEPLLSRRSCLHVREYGQN